MYVREPVVLFLGTGDTQCKLWKVASDHSCTMPARACMKAHIINSSRVLFLEFVCNFQCVQSSEQCNLFIYFKCAYLSDHSACHFSLPTSPTC